MANMENKYKHKKNRNCSWEQLRSFFVPKSKGASIYE